MLARSDQHHNAIALFANAVRLLASEQPFPARIQEVLAQLRTIVRYDDARLVCWFHGDGPLGQSEQFLDQPGWQVPWDSIQTSQIADRRVARCIMLEDQPTNPYWYYGAPVIWGGQLWGILELRLPGVDPPSASEQELIMGLLPLIAAAIAANAGPGIALQRRTDELTSSQQRLLHEIDRQLDEPVGLGEFFETLLHWAIGATGAEAGAVSLVDHDRGELHLQAYQGYGIAPLGYDAVGKLQIRRSWNELLAGKVAKSGRAALLRDIAHDPEFQPSAPEIRAELVFPMVHEGRTLALLQLDSPRSAAFGETEVAFVRALCTAAIQPLRRARRLQELLETSTQLGQVFSSIPTGMALLDTQGRVLRHNPAWTAVWGLGPLELGNSFQVPWDLMPLLLPRLSEPLALTDFAASGQSNPEEVLSTTLVLKVPHQELYLLSVPTHNTLGQTTGRLWAATDVTREREAERLKNEFVAVVSHELRTPLTSILGYTELLMNRSFKPKEQKAFITTVYDQANHLSQVVEDLLSITRLESGRMRLNLWSVSMIQLVMDVLKQFNLQFNETYPLLVDVDEQLPPAYIDRDKVKQIFINLIGNAFKYSPNGGEIIISLHADRPLPDDHPPGRWILVAISDHGLGIAEADLPQIWERFFRVDNTNTRKIGGSGLGLSIVKSLVELHGGRIWVESTLHQGSTFSFTLPMVTELARAT